MLGIKLACLVRQYIIASAMIRALICGELLDLIERPPLPKRGIRDQSKPPWVSVDMGQRETDTRGGNVQQFPEHV